MKGSIPDISPIFPGPACILANLLELDDLLGHSTNVSDLICIYTSLLDDFPSIKCGSDGLHMDVVDSLHDSLCKRITAAFTSESPLVEFLVNTRTRDINFSYPSEQLQDVSSAMKQIGCFINILLDTFGNGPISVLACHTDFILEIFKFLDLLEKSNQATSSDLLADARLELIILLPIFSLIFKNILETIDRKCFYELHKPFSFDELQKVVVLLKKVLWNLLCDSPLVDGTSSNGILGFRKLSLEKLKTNARQSIGELLVELQDWNIFEKFTSATNFCCDEISEDFVTKALEPGSLECQILQCAPFLIPFDIRSAILQRHLFGSKSTNNSFLKIRRNHILEDSLQLSLLTEEELRGKIWVTFITEDGESEQGVDLGGLFREFLDDASVAAFNPDNKMMKETKKAQLYPNPNSGLYKEDHLKVFHFLGTLLGKAIFGRVPLNLPPFAPFFIRKFMQKSIHINHLKSLDEDLYESLHTIKALGNVSDACLSFCTESGGRVEELLYGGQAIEVSNCNVNSYVNLHCSHFLNYLIEQQSVHFTKGLLSVIKKEWINMFNEMEFQLIISGIQVDTGLDIDDMYNNTTYHQYVQSDTTIRIFWEVLKELNPATQRKFLKFFSAQSCVPYNGFRDLDPNFNIKRLDIGDTENVQHLPSVSTCFNTLHLPPYDSKEVLKTKLLQTMEESSSFSMA